MHGREGKKTKGRYILVRLERQDGEVVTLTGAEVMRAYWELIRLRLLWAQ